MNTTQPRTTVRCSDGRARCWWCAGDALYEQYHDSEWGRPTTDDRYLFEKICLEGFQAGLSWITVLRKREALREHFQNFEIASVARMTARDIEQALGDARIIRHRGKIASAINNAQRVIALIEREGSLAEFVWKFAPKRRASSDAVRSAADIPAVTDASKALSKALKHEGFSFVGPTTMYAFMQSVGMVNDHVRTCAMFADVQTMHESKARPIDW